MVMVRLFVVAHPPRNTQKRQSGFEARPPTLVSLVARPGYLYTTNGRGKVIDDVHELQNIAQEVGLMLTAQK